METPPSQPPSGLVKTMMPLAGTDPTRPSDDLDVLLEIVGNARIVALGEPTHGQREVFQIKHRIIAWLVEEMGFTTFALEASVVGCRAMSRFVLRGEGDPEAAVKAQGFWTWSTEEVLDLVLWLREWNVAHPDRPVDVAGIDTQESVNAHRSLTTYIINQAPTMALDYISDLASIAAIIPGQTPYDAGEHARYIRILASLDRRIDLLPGADEAEVAVAHDDSLVIRQFLTLWAASAAGGESFSTARDRIMADRAARLTEATPESRVALWAHNAHIAKSRGSFWGDGTVVPMGLNLKARFVDDIVIVGIVFGAGGYQGIRVQDGQPAGLDTIDVGEPPAGSLDAALFAASDAPASLLDLGNLPDELQAWFSAPHVSRTAGALLATDTEMQVDLNVVQCFDVLAFVRETTRSVPL